MNERFEAAIKAAGIGVIGGVYAAGYVALCAESINLIAEPDDLNAAANYEDPINTPHFSLLAGELGAIVAGGAAYSLGLLSGSL